MWIISVLIGLFLAACGPNYKSHQMVNYELLTQPQKIERLKIECPKLVEQSLAFYEKAKSHHQSNDREERDQYVTLARITWKTAEERAKRLKYERERSAQQKRHDQIKKLYNDTLKRKNKLLNLQKQRQAYLSQTQTAQEMSKEDREAKEKQHQALISEIQGLDEKAQKVKI